MAIQNVKEIAEYLESNKEAEEVKNFFGEIKKSFLDSDEIKTKISEIEKLAIERAKMKSPEEREAEKKAYFEEFKKIHKIEEPKDPFLKKLLDETEAMKKELETQKAIAKKEQLKSKVLPKMKGFESLADFFIDGEEETTIKKVDMFNELVTNFVKVEIEKKLGNGAYQPPQTKNTFAEEKGDDWFKSANPEEIRKFMSTLTGK